MAEDGMSAAEATAKRLQDQAAALRECEYFVICRYRFSGRNILLHLPSGHRFGYLLLCCTFDLNSSRTMANLGYNQNFEGFGFY